MTGTYEQIRRHNRTEDRLRRMDMSDIIEEIHKLEDDKEQLRGSLDDLLRAHHHARGDEYVDAAYDALEATQ